MAKSVFLYNKENIQEIEKLCKPLKEYLGITNFGYLKVLQNNEYLFLSNNEKLVSQYLLNVHSTNIFFKEYLSNHKNDTELNYILWPEKPLNLTMDIFIDNNYWNGISAFKKADNFIEMWWFATDKENTQIKNFFINNLNILNTFIQYFENERGKVLAHSPSNLAIYKDGFDFYLPSLITDKNDIQGFMNYVLRKGLKVTTKNGMIILSHRELECIKLLSKGHSAAIIANKLNISPKTVEKHIENVKYKSGYHFKSDIINFFHNDIGKFF